MTIPTIASLLLVAVPFGDWFVDGSSTMCGVANGSREAPFCTLAEAIHVATDGDTIHLAPGIYFENTSSDDSLEFIGTQGASRTILDGGGSGSVLTLRDGTHTVLRGLTLRNGQTLNDGGGISFVSDSNAGSLLIEECVLQGNRALGHYPRGGAVYTSGASLTLVETSLRDNHAIVTIGTRNEGYGGALYHQHGDLRIAGCAIEDNTTNASEFSGGGGVYTWDGSVEVTDSIVRGNVVVGLYANGGGLLAFSGGPTQTARIERTLFERNSCSRGGGAQVSMQATLENVAFLDNVSSLDGSALSLGSGPSVMRNVTLVGDQPRSLIYLSPGTSFQMESSIVWGNFSGTRFPVAGDATALANSVIDHSDVVRGWSGVGAGNLDAAPQFVDRAAGDLRLLATSPCIDLGDSTYVTTGVDLAGAPRLLDGDLDRTMVVDMGAHEFSHVTLAISGDPVPGGSLTVSATGTAGASTLLAVGPEATSASLLQPLGALFVQLGSQTRVFGLGPLPASATFSIPVGTSIPTSVFQALALGAPLPSGRRAGNVSNPVTVRVSP